MSPAGRPSRCAIPDPRQEGRNQALLTAPTLAEMAATMSDEPIDVAVPENLITDDGAGRARGRADDFELLL